MCICIFFSRDNVNNLIHTFLAFMTPELMSIYRSQNFKSLLLLLLKRKLLEGAFIAFTSNARLKITLWWYRISILKCTR